MSIQIFGLSGYDFSLKELASFLGKHLSIACTVQNVEKGQKIISLASDVDNDELEEALNLFNPYFDMANYIYESAKFKAKEGDGKKNHTGARDKKFKSMIPT